MAWVTPTNVATGDVLTASTWNQAVTENTTVLRDTHTSLSAQSTNTETGGGSADFTYSAAEITLTPGTWLVQGGASLVNTVTTDASSVSLWNQTTGAEVANSTGATATVSTTFGGGLTSRLVEITVTTNTAIRVRCKRNGASTIRAQSAAGAPSAFLNAYRVRTA